MSVYSFKCVTDGCWNKGVKWDKEIPITSHKVWRMCGGCEKAMKRVFLPPMITFNSPGFFVTDNKKYEHKDMNGKVTRDATSLHVHRTKKKGDKK